jgi:hypothetical protein
MIVNFHRLNTSAEIGAVPRLGFWTEFLASISGMIDRTIIGMSRAPTLRVTR